MIYGYCRVSTLRQASEGESLDVQRRQIKGYALMHGLAVDESWSRRPSAVQSRSRSARSAGCCSPGSRTATL